jgi:hypothetical protein
VRLALWIVAFLVAGFLLAFVLASWGFKHSHVKHGRRSLPVQIAQ